MNSLIDEQLSFIDNHTGFENDQKFNRLVWDYSKYPPRQIKIVITVTKDEEIQYIKDGSIIRIEQIKGTYFMHQSLTNLQQISNLKWQGKFGQNNQKIGQWSANWAGENLNNIGGWYSSKKLIFLQILFYTAMKEKNRVCGRKHVKIFGGNKTKVYEEGEYQNDQRKGLWKYNYNENEIAFGEYNKQGQKNGKWIELSNQFRSMSEIIYQGEYKNSHKVGIWDIFYKKDKDFQLIGGGYYHEGVKIGRWIELSDGFDYWKQITYNGEYESGKKVGNWVTFQQKGRRNSKQIGGGQYTEGVKFGSWIELSELFTSDSQTTYQGEYQNGKKVGRWVMKCIEDEKLQQIGLYQEGIKIGSWMELGVGSRDYQQVVYNGEYKNGQKYGRWNILQQRNEQFKIIGGGQYDEGAQIGRWIELIDWQKDSSQVTCEGEYIDGLKVGRWNFYFREKDQNTIKQIGGGTYQHGVKLGKWIEISDGFQYVSQIIYIGEYVFGKKIGLWEFYWNWDGKNIQIGGGCYNEKDQIKMGKWIELSDTYQYISQVTYVGQYKIGKKVGCWDFIFGIQTIGGGSYGDEGDGNKKGRWIELIDGFNFLHYGIHQGLYRNGKKIGRWDIKYQGKLIGGGLYDEQCEGIKIGQWMEFSDSLDSRSKMTRGEYRNGKKVGRWSYT